MPFLQGLVIFVFCLALRKRRAAKKTVFEWFERFEQASTRPEERASLNSKRLVCTLLSVYHPVFARRIDPSVSVFSLSLHRHLYIYVFPLALALSIVINTQLIILCTLWVFWFSSPFLSPHSLFLSGSLSVCFCLFHPLSARETDRKTHVAQELLQLSSSHRKTDRQTKGSKRQRERER